MKKLFAILLAVAMLASMATVASAAETTTLTTTVPAATYTLNIPADQEIPFGATKTEIGGVSVTNATGFAVDKNLEVTLIYNNFTSESVSTEIPYMLEILSSGGTYRNVPSGNVLTFHGVEGGGVKETPFFTADMYCRDEMYLNVVSEDWGKALAGEYSTTITFTCEVVVE